MACPISEDVEAWRASITDTFVPLEPQATGLVPFVGRINTRSVGGLSVSRLRVAGQHVARGSAQVRRSGTDRTYLVRQLSGVSHVRHDDNLLTVTPGDFLLLDPNRTYELRFDGECRQLCIQVPETWLRARDIHDLAPAVGRRLNARAAAARVLAATTDALLVDDARSAVEADDAAELFMDVLEHALLKLRRDEDGHAEGCRSRVGRLQGFIDSNYAVEGLSPADAASALGCSVRTVHNLANELGSSFGRLVIARRLDEAARQLAQGAAGVRVADVAYGAGFSDVSQFCRTFRARYEVSPRIYRALNGAGR